MPFVWTNNPNIPEATPPPVIGPTEVSSEVGLVANTVNVSPILGILSYNTPNVAYNVVYAVPSLNVKDLHVSHLDAKNVIVHHTATINTANIGAATINTANIVTATIANGTMGVDPTSNLQIATKEYVDAIIANSHPTGGNLQLLIQAAGDLLVGVRDNTAERLAVGTVDGAPLVAGGSGNTGVHWGSAIRGGSSTHRNLVIGTNRNGVLRNTQIQIVSVDEIVMDDGTRIGSGWNGLIADITSNVDTSGVGYLDTGIVQPNTCYEVYAVRNSSTASQGLILHRAVDRRVDIHLPATLSVSKPLNFAAGVGLGTSINVAMSFFPNKTGPLTGIDIALKRIGNPVGNVWVTIETDNGAGNTSGTILATSRLFDANRVPLDSARIRIPFDATANVVSGNTYWAVVHVDYSRADTSVNPNYLQCFGDSTIAYNGGAKFFNANTNGWAFSNSSATIDAQVGPGVLYFRSFVEANSSSVVMPAGYDQKCLVTYCSTTPLTALREYLQRGTKMGMGLHYTWAVITNVTITGGVGSNNTTQTGLTEAINMEPICPPVPCFVWFNVFNGLLATAQQYLAPIGSNDLGGGVSGQALEATGQLGANTMAATLMPIGPILIEQQCVLTRMSAATQYKLYIGGIEY